MISRDEFYKEFGRYLGVPADVTILYVEEEAVEWKGCPTCGGDMEYFVTVTGRYSDNKRYYQTFGGRVSDFINHLD